MEARLTITASSYVLSYQKDGAWIEVAALPGGSTALLPGDGLPDDAALEMAIERAEDWVMPHATGLSGGQLEVIDSAGRLGSGLQEVFASQQRQWSVAQLESLFNEIAFRSARPHTAATLVLHRAFVADLVLLRELAHHAKLQQVRLGGG
ncbi:MAG: hypothetical protein ACAH21_04725 [Ramlibacter sp.]|nr:hypothetical protein [Ramlibacter sp.]